MKTGTIAVLGIAAAAAALALAGNVSASGDGGSGGGGGGGGDEDVSKKQRIWAMLESVPELDVTQRYFLMLTAYGEGNYNPAAHNGSVSESAAAKAAAAKLLPLGPRLDACGIPRANVENGSWGTFQRLAPYFASDVFSIFGEDSCALADPTKQTANLPLQIALAIKNARTLQGYQGWQAKPTVGNLRLGWWSPAQMGYLSKNAARIEKYRQHARKVGLPAGIVDAEISRFPGNYVGIYDRLRQAFG